jgi:hypothetical protein
MMCRIGAAWALPQRGYPDQARQRRQEALARAQMLASPFNRCNLLLFLACLHLFRREWDLAQQSVEESLHLATAHGFPFYVAIGTIVWGTTRAAQEQAQAGVAHIRPGLAAWHTMGTTSLDVVSQRPSHGPQTGQHRGAGDQGGGGRAAAPDARA